MNLRGLLAASPLLVGLALACSDPETPTPCKDIPTGGCPSTTDSVCQDPTCASVYDCVSGQWVYDYDCPPHEGGTGGDDASADAPPEAPGPRDVNIDVPPGAGGGPGCADLQTPDCSLGTALACTSGCCDCDDLFVCQNGGWQLWGQCVNGQLVSSP